MSWIHRGSESLRCSPVAVEGCTAPTCSAGDPCARSSGKRAPSGCSSRASTTARCHHSQSGMTCAPLTGCPGVVGWMSSQADSPVSRSASRAGEPPGMTCATGGLTPRGSLARWDRASRTWRTCQVSLLGLMGTDEPYSETLPTWGLMRSGRLHTLPAWERPITARVSGYSPGDRVTVRCEVGWPNTVEWWSARVLYDNVDLIDVERSDGVIDCYPREWVLPVHLPTPTKNDAKNTGSPARRRRRTVPLDGLVRGPLNPEWIEWIMGWPQGATDSQRSVTGRCLSRWRTRSSDWLIELLGLS